MTANSDPRSRAQMSARAIAICTAAFLLSVGCRLDPVGAVVGGITGSSERSGARLLATSANDIDAVCPVPEDFLGELQPQPVTYWPTEPGYYRLRLETHCLQAGTHGPSEGTGFQLVPPRGPLGPHIRAILLACADHPDIDQSTIQRLLWAMLNGTGYDDLMPPLRRAASRMLPAHLLADYVGRRTLAPEAVDAAMPGELRRTMSFLREFRERVNDVNTTFAEVERMAVLDGDPSEPPTIHVPGRAWSVTPAGHFWRIRPTRYSLVRADYYIPYPCRIETDEFGRVTYFEMLDGSGYSITTSYQADKDWLEGPDGRQYPIWRFARVEFRGPDPDNGGTLVVTFEQEGWMFAREARDMWPQLVRLGGTEARYYGVPRWMMTNDDGWHEFVAAQSFRERFDQARDAYGEWEWFRDQAERAGRPTSQADLDAISDRQHYENGLETIGKPREQSKWFHEHLNRVSRAWRAAADALGGLLPGGGSPEDAGPAGFVNQPGNNGRQRIGTSSRFAR